MNEFHVNTEKILDLVIAYLPKLVLAILTLIVGLWLIRVFMKGLARAFANRNIDDALRPFLRSVISVVLKVLLSISVMGMIGIEMTSFIALLGAVGISIGMALSGALQHFAGGVLIMIYKPFKKGDFIEAQGHKGNVMEIRIFNTVLNTIDNKVVFIPNGPLSTGTIVNFSTEENRRIDMNISVSYKDDVDKTKTILRTLIKGESRIHKEPAPLIAVSELGVNAVNIAVRVWVKNSDYLDVNYAFLEAVKREFDSNGITIPSQQMEISLKRNNS